MNIIAESAANEWLQFHDQILQQSRVAGLRCSMWEIAGFHSSFTDTIRQGWVIGGDPLTPVCCMSRTR